MGKCSSINNNEALSELTLSELNGGCHQAFFKVYETYHKSLYHFVNGYLNNGSTAEDIVHDVFLKLWEIRSRVNPQLPVINYLYRIARNAAFKELKKGLNTSSLKKQLTDSGLQFETSVEVGYQIRENEVLFNRAIDYLPLQRQRVFRLCRLNEKTYKEAATELGVSPHTVKEHMSLAMKSIKKYVSE